ncbi:MAG TPA: serine hydrolase domain-containing protein [Actinomycetota bacterium]|nr:serine hydrolase domain-containing protein [Actinomycetota bacterium]
MAGLQEAFERVGASLEHHLTASHAAGAALAVTDREEILGVVVRGMADVASAAPVRPETRFQIGSISKSFAAIVAMQEVDADRLDLHVSVNELLPWLGLPEPFGPITVHHLLTHTAGLHTGTEDAPGFAGAMHLLRSYPATSAPGERYHYSNDGYKIVGAVLEAVTGQPIHELLLLRLLGPLGMTASVAAITDEIWTDHATGYEPLLSDRPAQLRHPLVPAPRIVSNTADGSIVSNVVDMCAYARLLLASGDRPDERGERLLSEDGFTRLMAHAVDDDDHGTYGYGLWNEVVDRRTWLGHSGGMVGYTALLITVPEEGLGCVMLQNGGGDKRPVVGAALATVRAALAGEPLPEAWVPPAPTAIPDAGRFTGSYPGDDGRTLLVDATEDGLSISVGPVSARLERDPLLAEAGETFLVAHPALERFPLEFRRNGTSVVEAFHGDTWFRGERYEGPEPQESEAAWRRHPGLYRNDDPWNPVLRIVLRKGRLAIMWPTDVGDEEGGELVPLEDGSFAVGDPILPRRVRFEGDLDGMSVVTVFNGGRWYRSFEP